MFDLADFIADHLKKDRPFVAPVKVSRKGRQSKNPVNWTDVDLRVFKAMLLLTNGRGNRPVDENKDIVNGGNIAKVIETCPTFVRKDATGNRAIIRQSLTSLQERGLVKISDKGRDQYITVAHGASMASYYPRNGNPPQAIVYRRITVKPEVEEKLPETPAENVEQNVGEQTDPDFFDDDDFDDDDFDDIDADLSVG